MKKSDKFRELIAEEQRLKDLVDDCETAQYRMLNKAFKRLGLNAGNFGVMVDGKANIAIAKITDWSVEYYRYSGILCETCEISFEDLFDAEVQQ